ncbi:MAG: epoxyqueuosine reductase QueH [Desulfarculaceae bacterium]|nr:epoxyqueuosine reductase QueH [Desulfarculaceae bacterium]
MRILLHICCGPCAIMPVHDLRHEGHELRALFYNPNIQPYTENQRRLQTLESWAAGEELPLIVQDEYDPESWLRNVAWRESERCAPCLAQRLERAAAVAKRGGFDAFSSTLLYSKRQKHRLIKELGTAAGKRRGVEFLYRDWRPFWQEGIERSKAAGMYRQQYCGCIFSERDRFLGSPAGPTGRKQS